MTMEQTIQERVKSYWKNRSASFLEQRIREFHSPLKERWITEFDNYIPQKTGLKILDIGCGTGFFTGILSQMGHEVIGIDVTQEMIHLATFFANQEKFDAQFLVMDAQNLEFKDASFDIVIARNVTWTLPDVPKAYQEWLRVLKKGGLLINIDGNYGASSMTDTSHLPQHHAHHHLSQDTLSECEMIQRSLTISSEVRPQWDVQYLLNQEVDSLQIDRSISQRIYLEKDEFYNPTPLFLLCAKK